jgi:hypothetical protein
LIIKFAGRKKVKAKGPLHEDQLLELSAMYNKKASAILKQEFWTSFGRYLAPVPSAEGLKINWVNYRTGAKDIYFKMEAGDNTASISILLTHTDHARRTLFFNLFKQLQPVMYAALQEEWQWAGEVAGENGKTTSKIYTTLKGVSIYKKEDWPLIISFLKPRIISLDAFWNDVKFGFEGISPAAV